MLIKNHSEGQKDMDWSTNHSDNIEEDLLMSKKDVLDIIADSSIPLARKKEFLEVFDI